jgi:hypothetical protein
MFKYQGQHLINEKGKAVIITGKLNDADIENRNVGLTSGSTRNILTQWTIVYVKDYKRDLRKGEVNRVFGFRVGVDFHIVTRMRSGRYLDLVNSYDTVLKTPNGRSSQRWYFDNNSKTIRSRRTTSYSLEIASNGNSNNLRAYSTGNRWW